MGISDGLADSAWPVFHGSSKLGGLSTVDTSHLDGSVKWRFRTEHWMESSPVIGPDNTIYFADHNCNLYAVTPEGEEKWRFSGGEPVYSKEWDTTSCSQATPAVARDGTIYFLPMTGNLYAVTPEGKEKWRYPVFAFKNVWASPTVGKDGTVYVGSEAYPPSESGKPQEKAAHFYAINPDGTLKWQFNSRSVWMNSTPSIADDGTIYLPGGFEAEQGRFVNAVYAFNSDGTIKWNFLPPGGVLEGSIAIGVDNNLYFTTKGERDPRQNAFVYALTPEGREIWKYPLEAGASMTPGIDKDGNLYVGDWFGKFYALNKNGKLLWELNTPSGFEVLHSSPAIGADGTMYFGSGAGYFYAFTLDGEKKWEYEVPDGGVMGTPAIGSDGTVYTTTLQRELLAFGKGGKKNNALNTSLPVSSNNMLPIILASAIAIGIFVVIYRKNKIAGFVFLGIAAIAIGGFVLLRGEKPMPEQRSNNEFGNYERKEVTSVDNICPERVYGSDKNGYYATFYIDYNIHQFDVTPEQINWVRKNCNETIWPEQMYEGYKGE